MKRFKIILCLVMGIVLLTGCSKPELSDKFNKKEVEEKSEEVINLVNEKDSEELKKISNDQMKSELTDQTLGDFYGALATGGKFKEIESIEIGGGKNKDSNDDFAVAIVKTIYEDRNFTYTITFTEDMELGGLYCK